MVSCRFRTMLIIVAYTYINILLLPPTVCDVVDLIYLYGILAVSEAWLHKHIANSGIAIAGYYLVCAEPRSIDSARGKGVAMYIRDGLSYDILFARKIESP